MTPSEKRIEIALSKQKLLLMLVGSIVFVGIGLWFVIAPPNIENTYWGNPLKIMLAGYASIFFFGLLAIFFLHKLQDNKPGLIIDDQGLLDNSGAVSAGQIWWTDIEYVSVIEINRQKLIMIQVKNPQDYIDRQTSSFKRKIMSMNYKMYGTPLSITSNGLKIPFDELFSILTSKLNASR